MAIIDFDIPRWPFFGQLDEDNEFHKKLFVQRFDEEGDNILDLILHDLAQAPEMGRPYFGVVTGTPGSGKSTFCRFLTKKLENSIYLNLDDHAVLTDNASVPLTIDSLIDFFGALEKSFVELYPDTVADTINEIEKQLADVKSKFLRLNEQNSQPDFEIVKADIKTRLVSWAKTIDTPTLIVADNVDYVHTRDQTIFVALLSEMTKQNAQNVKVIFAGRPVSSGLARHSFRDLHEDNVSHNYHFVDLSVSDVVDPRIKNSKAKKKNVEVTEEAQDLIGKLACGNVDKILGVYEKIYNTFSAKKLNKYRVDVPELFKIIKKHSLSSFLPDIFDTGIHHDRIPTGYATLSFFKNVTDIDEEFYNKVIDHFD